MNELKFYDQHWCLCQSVIFRSTELIFKVLSQWRESAIQSDVASTACAVINAKLLQKNGASEVARFEWPDLHTVRCPVQGRKALAPHWPSEENHYSGPPTPVALTERAKEVSIIITLFLDPQTHCLVILFAACKRCWIYFSTPWPNYTNLQAFCPINYTVATSWRIWCNHDRCIQDIACWKEPFVCFWCTWWCKWYDDETYRQTYRYTISQKYICFLFVFRSHSSPRHTSWWICFSCQTKSELMNALPTV